MKRLYNIDGTPTEIMIGAEIGNYDDYISDVVATSDGGYLLGGWYYSDGGIDVDGDGTTTGQYDFPELSGGGTSDGFIIKLDSEGQVQYTSRLYGEGYQGVTAVAEGKTGNLLYGGYYTLSDLSATNYEIQNPEEEEETSSEVILEGKGYSEGFIISKVYEGGITVAETQNLQIENKVKTFKITTEVIKHDEGGVQVAGGDITGEEGTFGGVE